MKAREVAVGTGMLVLGGVVERVHGWAIVGDLLAEGTELVLYEPSGRRHSGTIHEVKHGQSKVTYLVTVGERMRDRGWVELDPPVPRAMPNRNNGSAIGALMKAFDEIADKANRSGGRKMAGGEGA